MVDAAGSADTFRPDIEGLRGVAVLLVLLFHASLLDVSGGFVGVDVFFVVSGFLITGLLLRERERTGTIRLRAFYARRVRRLLPAGIVVLVCTLGASLVFLAPLDRPSAALDAAAAALSVGNIRFAITAGDYFAAVGEPSPFLHFWSLAVEEQFYLLWPALVLGAAARGRPRISVGLALVGVAVASLAADLVLTQAAVEWAFYSLPARAWELAIGGLLAVGAAPLGRIPRALTATLGWLGLAAVVAAAVTFDASLAYPGAWALVPTVGTAAIVLAGTNRSGPAAVLASPPLRFLGRISYSLYLWHWPILVLPAAAVEGALPPFADATLASVAVLVAWLSWRFVEEPVRTGFPSLVGRPGRTVLAGATAILLVAVGAGGIAEAGPGGWPAVEVASALEVLGSPSAPPPGSGASDAGSLSPPSPSQPGSLAATPAGSAAAGDATGSPPSSPPSVGMRPPSAAGRPAALATGPPQTPPAPSATRTAPTYIAAPAASSQVAAPAASSQAYVATPTASSQDYVALPANVRPPLDEARSDEERLRADGCLAFEPDTIPRDCVYGDPNGSFSVALVGDSHAAQWFPALEQVALAHHWRILTFVKVACPFLDIPVINISLKRQYDECAAYDAAAIARLSAIRPDLTLVSMSRYAIHPVRPQDASIGAEAASLARMLRLLPGRVAVIVDTPDGGRDIPACLSWHPDDVRLCAVPRSVAFAGGLGAIERAATAATGDSLIDLTGRVCRGDPCPVVVDGMIVFRDMRHMTATFARSLGPDLDAALRRILAIT